MTTQRRPAGRHGRRKRRKSNVSCVCVRLWERPKGHVCNPRKEAHRHRNKHPPTPPPHALAFSPLYPALGLLLCPRFGLLLCPSRRTSPRHASHAAPSLSLASTGLHDPTGPHLTPLALPTPSHGALTPLGRASLLAILAGSELKEPQRKARAFHRNAPRPRSLGPRQVMCTCGGGRNRWGARRTGTVSWA